MDRAIEEAKSEAVEDTLEVIMRAGPTMDTPVSEAIILAGFFYKTPRPDCQIGRH